MSIRSLAAATLVAGVLSSAAAFAADAPAPTGPFGGNIAGSVAGVTDYRYRGISQTRKDPAVQGYLEYALPVAGDAAAVYGSLWGSNISFGGNLETDWTAGVRGAVMDGKLSYDVNALRYAYPGSNGNANLDFWEFGGKLTYDFGMVAPYVGFRWSPDFQLQSGDAEYYTAGVTVPLPFLADYKPTIVAEYGPPPGISLHTAAALLNKPQKVFAAAVVDLAVRGVLVIEEFDPPGFGKQAWAVRLIKSTGNVAKSNATRPVACAASTCKSTPFSRHAAPMAAMS